MKLIYLVDELNATVERIIQDQDLQVCGLTIENVTNTLKSFDGDEIASSVFLKKYALRDENNKIIEFTLEEAKYRWAKAISETDSSFSNPKKIEYFMELYEYFLPAGRQMLALGNDYLKKATLSNCYVTQIEEDSIEGIFDAAKRCARTFSFGGGTGTCLGSLRPAESKVSNSSKFSTGAVSFMELYSMTTGLIGQQSRRGALMITIPIDHPDVVDFIEIKHNNKEKVKFANISIKLTDEFMKAVENNDDFVLRFKTPHEIIMRTVKAKDLWNKIIISARDSAEPGLLFWDRMVEMSPSEVYPRLKVHSTNPCITGDTLVYTADGRGNVAIKDLAEEDKDVPVFCLNDKQRLAIRTMRHPRITGLNQAIYKITLDDGSFSKATGNHKFLLKSGDYKEVRNLQKGDSLYVLTKFESSLTDVILKSVSNRQDYYFVDDGTPNYVKAEHKLIAEFHNNIKICKGYVVHHKDFNGKNNFPDNLQIMTQEDHKKLHSEYMFGENNPMKIMKREWTKERWEKYSNDMSNSTAGEKNGQFSGITNDEIKKHAIILTQRLGYRFSEDDWFKYAKENNLIIGFSKKYRKEQLGNIRGLSVWAAYQCGLENVELDPRMQKTYLKLTEQGYNCKVMDGTIYVIKNCEVCNREYELFYRYRESGICSKECLSKYLKERSKDLNFRNKMTDNLRLFYNEQKKRTGEEQVRVFLELKQKLSRDPKTIEFVLECKNQSVPYRTKKDSYFHKYTELKEAASRYNHKIVSVEFIGYEDVYNGTVDEFHNFFVGGFESVTDKGKKKFSYLNNLNCGEEVLEPGGSCCLGSLLLHKFVAEPFTNKSYFNFDVFTEMVKRGVRHLDNIVELNMDRHPLEEQKEAARLGRRIGLGITGLADMFASLGIKYDSDQALDLAGSIMEVKRNAEYEESINLAKIRGAFPLYNSEIHFTRGFATTLPKWLIDKAKENGLRNVAISTIAPSGSISIIAQCSSGMEPIYAFNYVRKVMLGKEEDKKFVVHHPGVVRYYEVSGLDDLPCYWITAHDVDYKFRVKLQGVMQKNIDASISSTANVSKDTSVETIGQIYMDAWKENLKGITVYREGSREGVLLSNDYAKEIGAVMNTTVNCVRAEGGDKFYIMISYENMDIKKPYQVFVMNYKRTETDTFVKISNSLIKMLRDNKVEEKRITKYINRSENSLVKLTRFLSLSMKTNNLTNALKVLDEHAFAGTLAVKLYEILSKSVDIKFVCPSCKSSNIKSSEGCLSCLDCQWSRCS